MTGEQSPQTEEVASSFSRQGLPRQPAVQRCERWMGGRLEGRGSAPVCNDDFAVSP